MPSQQWAQRLHSIVREVLAQSAHLRRSPGETVYEKHPPLAGPEAERPEIVRVGRRAPELGDRHEFEFTGLLRGASQMAGFRFISDGG
jgi:hypothetical protein